MFILSFMDRILSVEVKNYIYTYYSKYISYIDYINKSIEKSKIFDFYIPVFVLQIDMPQFDEWTWHTKISTF